MSSYVQPVIEAFWKGEKKKINNTRTEDFKLYLFDNCIAWIDNKELWIDTCGWKSVTTRDRLQMLNPTFYLKVIKGTWYLATGEEDLFNLRTTNWLKWDGDKININRLYEIKK